MGAVACGIKASRVCIKKIAECPTRHHDTLTCQKGINGSRVHPNMIRMSRTDQRRTHESRVIVSIRTSKLDVDLIVRGYRSFSGKVPH
jgi:hypothetical protein